MTGPGSTGRSVGGFGMVLRMAWRETRAAPRRLLLLTGAIAVGVAALVAVNSFTANLQDSVRSQAQALLGADLAFSSRRAFPALADSLLDALEGTRARVTNFSAMSYVPRTDGTRLVQVSAVDGPFHP
jgi:putative ABC transport system permease protein